MRVFPFLTATVATAIGLGALSTTGACSGRLTDLPDGSTPPVAKTVTTTFPDAGPLPGQKECKVVVTRNIPLGNAIHVDMCSHVSYATNPPSGGDHWPQWAAYRIYDVPVSREMYVHNLEHGAVVLAYRCEQADCPDVVKVLTHSFQSARDSFCAAPSPARVVMTQDMLLDTPIAASAWGATYTATCIDEASLTAFVKSSIGKGTEALCFDGLDIQSAGDPCAWTRDGGFVPDGAPVVDASVTMDGGF